MQPGDNGVTSLKHWKKTQLFHTNKSQRPSLQKMSKEFFRQKEGDARWGFGITKDTGHGLYVNNIKLFFSFFNSSVPTYVKLK